jgi:hypothetical protein
VTREVFLDWFTSYFCNFLKEYSTKNNLDNKALLILDNAPGHPTYLDDHSDDVRVVFLPPNTTPLLQPMDQGVIKAFKTYYVRRIMNQVNGAIDSPDRPTVRDFSRNYNITKAIKNTGVSWDEATQVTMNEV